MFWPETRFAARVKTNYLLLQVSNNLDILAETSYLLLTSTATDMDTWSTLLFLGRLHHRQPKQASYL